jgi:glycosyltransferase involved in cell wall biosynthesis
MGFWSDIYCEHVHPQVVNEVFALSAGTPPTDSMVIYHHSIDSEAARVAAEHPGSKCLIYHNITPPEFFRPYRPDIVPLLERGRSALTALADSFPFAIGVSDYNRAELVAAGFANTSTIPLVVNPAKWDMTPDEALMARLQDGKRNLVFVGRIVPNKCQHHLVVAFADYLTMDPDARLILVGPVDSNDPYSQRVTETIRELELTGSVVVTGHITEKQLLAYWRTAHLYWSMSEHEGFGVPLIEAMWFDVPVLAFKSSAIPETLGDAGIIFRTKKDLLSVAALAKLMATDDTLRQAVLAQQRRRRVDFLPEKVRPAVEWIVEKLLDRADGAR